MGVKDWLISARFMATIGHFTALLLLFSTYEVNVNVGLKDNASSSDKSTAMTTTRASLIFGSFCFGFDFIGIFFGTSLFLPMVNIIQIFFHVVGSIFLSWVITGNWNYTAFWPIIALSSIPPALIEASILVFIYGLKIYKP